MLSKERNERLTRVGPGTPMGKTLRRYWMPVVLSWELPEPDCAPVRVRILGENLVAFRTTDGKVGLLDEYCPHRQASLWLGRNEENGIRCVYHGWKFDTAGQCVEQMNEPRQFCENIRTVAYPTCEIAGVIWAYMGPKDKQPVPPDFDWARVPDTHRVVSKVAQECNWLQALEGGIDTSHFTILHRTLKKGARQGGVPPDDIGIKGSAPSLELDVTEYGYRYFGIRSLGDGSVYVRGYHFVMPFTQIRPPGPGKQETHGHYWVPIDDHNCMVWNFFATYGVEPIEDSVERGNTYGIHVDEKNGFKSIFNRSNNWMIDREMQRTETFTGIDGINTQDRAVQESMGPIVDRTKEHLGPSDKAITATRRLLLEATDAVERDEVPLGLTTNYDDLRPAEGVFPSNKEWRKELIPQMISERRYDKAPA